MADAFYTSVKTLDSPVDDGFAVTASDSTVFSQPTRALYVGTTGNVAVQMHNKLLTNTNLTFVAVPARNISADQSQ
jgi:hypothetical protein